MYIIDSSAAMARALAAPIADNVRRLLTLRRDQLSEFEGYDLGELGRWLIIEPSDTIADIEANTGVVIVDPSYPANPDHAPPWEWVLDHGGLYEAPIIMSDDGFGTVLLVPDQTGIDPVLLHLLKADAEAAEPLLATVQSAGPDSE
jgi:hypothetical protein